MDRPIWPPPTTTNPVRAARARARARQEARIRDRAQAIRNQDLRTQKRRVATEAAYRARVRNAALARAAKARYHAARVAARRNPTPSPPAKIGLTIAQAREKARRKAIMAGDIRVSPAHQVAQTTKSLFGVFKRDGAIARATRRAITGDEHGHIGNHLRTKRKKWFGFGRRRRKTKHKKRQRRKTRRHRRRRRKTRRHRRRSRGGCGGGRCLRGGRRRTRRR